MAGVDALEEEGEGLDRRVIVVVNHEVGAECKEEDSRDSKAIGNKISRDKTKTMAIEVAAGQTTITTSPQRELLRLRVAGAEALPEVDPDFRDLVSHLH